MERAGMRAVAPVQGGLFYQARTFIPKLAVARHLPMLTYSKETFENPLTLLSKNLAGSRFLLQWLANGCGGQRFNE
jgi:hypothetical protein